MKTIQINANTVMFIDPNSSTIYGMYNYYNKVLAYNKPVVRKDEMSEMEEFIKDDLAIKFPTDSFSVQFWDHQLDSYVDFSNVA